MQFWWVFIILPLFEKSFELADALPIATVLNNSGATDANANVVDVLLMLSVVFCSRVYLRRFTTIVRNIVEVYRYISSIASSLEI
jgi:hypothetical protein